MLGAYLVAQGSSGCPLVLMFEVLEEVKRRRNSGKQSETTIPDVPGSSPTRDPGLINDSEDCLAQWMCGIKQLEPCAHLLHTSPATAVCITQLRRVV